MKDIEKEAEEILDTIDEAGSPSNMTQAQWAELLAILISDLQSRHQAVLEEME